MVYIMYSPTYIVSVIIIICSLYLFTYYHYNKTSFATRDQIVATDAKALVISCMDFRLIDDLVHALDKMGYNNNYNNIVVAGASLGYNQTVSAAWRKTVDDHIQLSQKMHGITQIIVVDHMRCGAYNIFYDKPNLTRDEELELHKENFIKFRKLMKYKYPEIEILTYIMDIDGRMIF